MVAALFFSAVLNASVPASSPSGGSLPPALLGTWDVVRVAVDLQDSLHWGFRPDDPRLLGRSLLLTTGRVQLERGKHLGCAQSIWPARQSSWEFLFGKGFLRPTMGGRSGHPLAEDFGFHLAGNQRTTVYSLCPDSKSGPFPGGHWVAVKTGELLLHYDNQVLLELRRRPLEAIPVASFSCPQAVTPSEKTICSRFELASFDRSVAQAFRQALERRPDLEEYLRKDQKAWRGKMDSCGSNEDCLYEGMWGRVDELTSF